MTRCRVSSTTSAEGWLWTYLRDDRPFGGAGPPIVVYRFEDSRGAGCLERHLAGWRGILQCDGYAAYPSFANRSEGRITLAACWAHARRKFDELAKAHTSPVAEQALQRIAWLYRVETPGAWKDEC